MKPKPFVSSFWGIVIVLIIAIAMLGVANYRGYRAGFNLPFIVKTLDQLKPTNKELGTAYLFTNAAELSSICKPSDTVVVNWDKQVAFGYTITNLNAGYRLQPLSIRRQGTVIDISYQRATPEDNPDAAFTQAVSHPVILTILDRTKLIASSEITLNFIINGVTTGTLQVPPNKI